MKTKITSLLLAAAMTAGLLAGCGSATSSSGSTAETGGTVFQTPETSGTKVEGGNINIAITADPQDINPLYVVDQTSFDVMQALYSPFFEIVHGEMYYGNGLCENVTSNDDATEFTLTLKDGLMWDDGEPITADDVVFTMQVLVDENQNVPYSSYGFIDGQPVQAEKVDDRTVKLILPKSSAGFLGGLSQVYCIPKHIYEGVENIGDSDLNNNPVGCGPFKFDEYKSGEYIRVVKNDKWFNDVNLDSITFRIIKDANSANAALASGDLDARLISADEYQTVSGYSNVNIYAYNSGRVNAMFLNQSTPALQDVRVRQAIAYGLNKQELCNFAFLSEEYADPAYSILTPDTLYYTEPDNVMDNDPEKATELLTEAGQQNLTLRLMYVSTDKTEESQAIYIQSTLANIGITIDLVPTDESTFKNKTKDPTCTDYDLVLSYYTLGEEPSLYADMITSDSRSNMSHVKDTDLDALWTEGNSTADETKRAEIYAQIQNTINDNMYIYPIAYSNGFYAVSKNFGGFDECLLKTIYYDYSKIYSVQ